MFWGLRGCLGVLCGHLGALDEAGSALCSLGVSVPTYCYFVTLFDSLLCIAMHCYGCS
jgi:hypothetical protein